MQRDLRFPPEKSAPWLRAIGINWNYEKRLATVTGFIIR